MKVDAKKNSKARTDKRRIDLESRKTSTNATNAAHKHPRRQAARGLWFGLILLAFFGLLWLFISGSAPDAPSPTGAASQQSEQPATTQVRDAYGQMPLSFEVNRGQADEAFNFLARGEGYTLALSPTRAVFALARRANRTVAERRAVARQKA